MTDKHTAIKHPRGGELSGEQQVLLKLIGEASDNVRAYSLLRKSLILRASESGVSTRVISDHLGSVASSTVHYWHDQARKDRDTASGSGVGDAHAARYRDSDVPGADQSPKRDSTAPARSS